MATPHRGNSSSSSTSSSSSSSRIDVDMGNSGQDEHIRGSNAVRGRTVPVTESTILSTVADGLSHELAAATVGPTQEHNSSQHNQKNVVGVCYDRLVLVQNRLQSSTSTAHSVDKTDQLNALSSRVVESTSEGVSSALADHTSRHNTTGEPGEERKPEALVSTIDRKMGLHSQTSTAFPLHASQDGDVVDTTPSGATKQQVTSKKRISKNKCASADESRYATGRWTDSEHQAFLRGLHIYGREWKKVASHIPTRTSAQVRSHAQKYFYKAQREKNASAAHNMDSGALQRLASAAIGDRALSAAQIVDNGMVRELSPEARVTVARIVDNPERVEAEVEETLQLLAQRYSQLQERLLRIEQQEHAGTSMIPLDTRQGHKRRAEGASGEDTHTALPTCPDSHELQAEELIALSVLQGSLPNSGSSVADGASQSSTYTTSSEMGIMETNNLGYATAEDEECVEDENTTTSISYKRCKTNT